MTKDDIDRLWDLVAFLEKQETNLYITKDRINDSITDIRHQRSKLTDLLLRMEKEYDEIKELG